MKVENNYFETSKDTIGWFEGPTTGAWDVSNNVFMLCSGAQPTTSTAQLAPPYAYTAHAPAGLPTAIPLGAGVGKL